MDFTNGLLLARTIARSGEHRNWRGVETRLQQLGHLDAEIWFSALIVRGEIDALCSTHFKGAL
jgi:hypothetical protein